MRATFRVDSIVRSSVTEYGRTAEGRTDHNNPIEVETQGIHLSFATGRNDEKGDAVNGSMTLGISNLEVAKMFELGKQYLVEITPAG